MVTLAVLLLRETPDKFRGRVMGVRMLVIYSLPLGLLAAGALIERIGFPATATLYSLVGLTFTLLIALRWRTDLRRTPTPSPSPRPSRGDVGDGRSKSRTHRPPPSRGRRHAAPHAARSGLG